MKNQPIGIFDSGVGGTSIWRYLIKVLPYENTIYLADSKYAPYGDKYEDRIINRSITCTDFLLYKNVKLVLVACNTATSYSIEILRKKYSIPFIGIEPGIKPALRQSKTKKVAVLATRRTLQSQLYIDTSQRHNNGHTIYTQAGTGLVELVEQGNFSDTKLKFLLKKYLQPLFDKGVDKLVLGCTHYYYLIPLIEDLFAKYNVSIIDTGKAVALQVRRILKKNNILSEKTKFSDYTFYSNAELNALKKIVLLTTSKAMFKKF